MSNICDKSNCDYCNISKEECEGDGYCYVFKNPKEYVKHKCPHNCGLFTCPICKYPMNKCNVDNDNGFCYHCWTVFTSGFVTLFPHKEVNSQFYNDFMKKMSELCKTEPEAICINDK